MQERQPQAVGQQARKPCDQPKGEERSSYRERHEDRHLRSRTAFPAPRIRRDLRLGGPQPVAVEFRHAATDDQPVSAPAQGWTERPQGGRTVVEAGFCATILLWLLVRVVRDGAFATDFRYAFWPAGRHVLDGTSP